MNHLVPLVAPVKSTLTLSAFVARLDVPCNEPVNPFVPVTLPLNMAGPIFVKVFEPDTVREPVITTLPLMIWLPVKEFEPVVANELVFTLNDPVWLLVITVEPLFVSEPDIFTDPENTTDPLFISDPVIVKLPLMV
jgi:hypothetical protein